MKYQVTWMDSTLAEHWTREQVINGMKKEFRELHIIDQNYYIEDYPDGWIDYRAIFNFEAKSDEQAKSLCKVFIQNNGSDITAFDLLNDEKVIMTDEDL